MLSREDFEGWRGDPRTREVLKFLDDYRDRFKELWAQGVDMDPQMQGQTMMLAFVRDLTHTQIESFYEQIKEQSVEQDND